MKVVWVTGARGFLGSFVVKRFAGANWTVAGLGLGGMFGASLADLPLSVIGGKPAWIEAPVNASSLSHLFTLTGAPRVVVHAAGPSAVGPSLSDPLQDFRSSVETTAVVLDFLRQNAPSARLVFPSSAAIYGIQPLGPIREDTEALPISPYGVHKLAAEWLCRSAAQNFSQPCTIVRYFSLYGVGLKKQLLWDTAKRLLAEPASISMMGSGEETRDFLHIEDAAELIFLAAENMDRLVLVNGGSGQSSTVRQIVNQLANALGLETRVHFTGQVRRGDPQHFCADTRRAEAIGFRPVWTIEAGLKSYAAWLREREKKN